MKGILPLFLQVYILCKKFRPDHTMRHHNLIFLLFKVPSQIYKHMFLIDKQSDLQTLCDGM